MIRSDSMIAYIIELNILRKDDLVFEILVRNKSSRIENCIHSDNIIEALEELNDWLKTRNGE